MTAPTPAGGNRRLYILLGIGGGLVLLNFVLPKLLFGGGDSENAAVPPRVTAPADAGGSGGSGSGENPNPPDTFETFTGKNPFMPVVGFVPTDSGGSESSTTTSTTFPTTGGGGSTTSTTSLFGNTTTTSTTLPTSTDPRPTQTVEMLEMYTDTDGRVVAQVRVDNTVYEVGVGDTFATSYQVVSLSLADQCGAFLFGDDMFTLCVGEELLK